MATLQRFSTGIPALDARLGGGLLPGTLTVVVGATGIGKTQLGVQFLQAGQQQEGTPGIIFDLSARIDAQGHEQYAERLGGRKLQAADNSRHPELDTFFDPERTHGDYLQIFNRSGRKVTQADVDFDTWHEFQAELTAKLGTTIAFFYGNFTRGVRRAVVDGLDPADRTSESIQFEMFEYIYHQILRKDADWVARNLFRQKFRSVEDQVHRHPYDYRQVACMMLYTSHESMLHEMIRRPLEDSDLLAGANTLIFMGKLPEGDRMARGMFIAKHRGSACSDDIFRYRITEQGLQIEGGE